MISASGRLKNTALDHFDALSQKIKVESSVMSSLSGLHKQVHTCTHTSVYKGHMHMNTTLHTQVSYDRLMHLHPVHVSFHSSSCSSGGHAGLFPLTVLFVFVPGPSYGGMRLSWFFTFGFSSTTKQSTREVNFKYSLVFLTIYVHI